MKLNWNGNRWWCGDVMVVWWRSDGGDDSAVDTATKRPKKTERSEREAKSCEREKESSNCDFVERHNTLQKSCDPSFIPELFWLQPKSMTKDGWKEMIGEMSATNLLSTRWGLQSELWLNVVRKNAVRKLICITHLPDGGEMIH